MAAMVCSSSSPSLGGSSYNCRRQHRSSITPFLSFTPVNRSPALSISSSKHNSHLQVFASSSPPPPPTSSLKLYVSGLSFRTSEETLRSAFESFGQLIEVNLVMDKIANRPRGFAFLRYATKEETEKAIEGMHGKFLDGRVIFVEYAKPRAQLQGVKQDSKPYR